jgi:quercetin dioxygenase-like cupin family protein
MTDNNGETPLQAGAAGVVKPAETVDCRDVAAGNATRMQTLIGPEDGARNFSMRRFIMGPQGGMPLHTNTVEHEQYVLRGRARVGIGSQVHEVGPADVLLIPAGSPHHYEVVEAPFEFLCIVPNEDDRVEILEREG